MVWVLVLLSPSASFTVRLTLYCLASGNWKAAVAVLASSCPSPSKSQLQLVTATSSVLLLTKVQAPPVKQDGRSKRATGAVLSGGGVPAPSLQAEASTSVPVTTASRPIDRIECSQLRSCPKGADMRRMSQSRATRPRSLRHPRSGPQTLKLHASSFPEVRSTRVRLRLQVWRGSGQDGRAEVGQPGRGWGVRARGCPDSAVQGK